MKQGKSLITFVMVALAAALAIYFGVYAANSLRDPFTTTFAYAYTAYDSVEADGLLVRQEEVLSAQAGIVDVTCGEGEKVGVGQTVALVYRDTQAQADQAQLEALAMEINLLQEAVSEGSGVEGTARLDEEVLQALVELRSSAALGDYGELEEQVLAVKSGVLKRGYTYGDGTTSQQLSQRLKELREEYRTLGAQTASATTAVKAQKAGTFSTLVDGYESTLTPQTVFQLTPDSLTALLEGDAVQDSQGLGKLITSDRWYFVCLLPQTVEEELREGETAQIRFSGDFTQDVDMEVEQLGPTQDGMILTVFSSDRYLSRTTLLRRQTAELLLESWSGLRIPKQALRMEKYTYEDEETDQTLEGSRLGVYVLMGGRAEFKEVELVTEGSDYYVVRAADNSSRALRAGDEVIVQATGLYDGQLLEF